MISIQKWTQWNLNYSNMHNNMGIRNLIALVPRAFTFVDKGKNLELVLLCKANLKHKEICALIV